MIGPTLRTHPTEKFQLTDVANLAIWLEAGFLTLADGAAVASWTDRSGAGLNAAQATGSKKPTFKTGITGGRAVLRFDGGDTMAATAFGAALSPPYTTFVVCQAVVSGISANQYVLNAQSGADRGDIYANNTSKKYAMFNATAGFDGGTSDAWVVISAIFNGASSSIRVNGTETTGTVGTGTFSQLCVGSNRDTGQYFVGDIAEVAMYSVAVSSTNRQLIDRWLGAKYGIDVA